MSPLRVGVVGAGIGVHYAESFQRVRDVEVVALCAGSTRNAAPAADRLGIEAVFTDFDEMLSQLELDIVAIATPNDLHHSMTLAALEAGAHVLCDKPLALNATEAREMLEAAQRRGLRHIVPFWWRFLPVVTRAHELLADGSSASRTSPTFAISTAAGGTRTGRCAGNSIGPEPEPAHSGTSAHMQSTSSSGSPATSSGFVPTRP